MKIRNNRFFNKALVTYRNLFCDEKDHFELRYDGYQDLRDQDANDYIYSILSTGKPVMISKFGTIELSNLVSRHIQETTGLTKEILHDFLHYDNVQIDPRNWLKNLCYNAGFFPYSMDLGMKWYEMMLEDIKEVDVLGSYVYEEKYVYGLMHSLKKKVNIDGYFAPFAWDNPWTRILKDKRVLVVHPFTESIRYQYENKRDCLFLNKDVLPEFRELILVKAVQTQANARDSRFANWFEALQYMKDEIDKHDYDIALIGCGAYGMCLAAHVKRQGKQAVHLASMTQILFGVYGKRWLTDEAQYSKYINSNWIRPNKQEMPDGAVKIENGCYW